MRTYVCLPSETQMHHISFILRSIKNFSSFRSIRLEIYNMVDWIFFRSFTVPQILTAFHWNSRIFPDWKKILSCFIDRQFSMMTYISIKWAYTPLYKKCTEHSQILTISVLSINIYEKCLYVFVSANKNALIFFEFVPMASFLECGRSLMHD